MKNKYEIHGNLAIVHLHYKNQKLVTFIDKDDFEKVNNIPGTISVHRNKREKFYAYLVINKKAIFLHRFIMGLDPEDPREVDHKNGDGLDNRKSKNLRVCTRAENSQNIRKSRGISQHLNVRWDKTVERWKVVLNVGGKRYYGGSFRYEEYWLAVKAANELRAEHMPYSKEAMNNKVS